MTGRTSRIVLLVSALAALSVAGGCMFVDAEFSMAPDGATSARMEAGMLRSMMEQAEDGDLATDLSEMFAEGRWTELEEFDRGQWHVKAWEGEAASGERLFVEAEDAPSPQFGIERHALTTVYTFELALPEDVMETETQPTVEGEGGAEVEAEDGAEIEVEGMEQMGAAMGEMMAMVMSSGQSGLRFSVRLPGEITSTTGERVAAGRVRWRMDLTEEEAPPGPLQATSRLPHWPNIGRLGGQLADAGRWELVPALIEGVRRGVVPDPLTENPTEAEFDAALYAQLLEIMVALDVAVGEPVASEVMTTLGLHGADVDPALVGEVHERVTAEDFGAQIESNVTEDVLSRLGGG